MPARAIRPRDTPMPMPALVPVLRGEWDGGGGVEEDERKEVVVEILGGMGFAVVADARELEGLAAAATVVVRMMA